MDIEDQDIKLDATPEKVEKDMEKEMKKLSPIKLGKDTELGPSVPLTTTGQAQNNKLISLDGINNNPELNRIRKELKDFNNGLPIPTTKETYVWPENVEPREKYDFVK